MREAFVGFDSAWGGHKAGAIAWAVFQDEVPEKMRLPHLVGFADAAEIVEDLRRKCDNVLVAIDQPIIVPNDKSCRPVDVVADALMQRLNSRALTANRTEPEINIYLHGKEAPVWKFMSKIGPCEYFGITDSDDTCAFVDFEATHHPPGTHVIEVYPALALAALNPVFMDRGSAARYDPENRRRPHPFSLNDWRSVCNTVVYCAEQTGLQGLSQWAREMVAPWDSPRRPRKLHQDKIDAALCLIVALQWRRQTNGVCAIGDLQTGYMVTPTSDSTLEILQTTCNRLDVRLRSAEKYGQFQRLEQPQSPTFGELLLGIPQDDQEFERLPISTRTLDF